MRWFVLLAAVVLLALGPGAAAGAAAPTLQVLAPADGAALTGDAVAVSFQVGDFQIVPSTVPISEYGKRPDLNRPGQGHLHLTLDTFPLVVWDQAGPYTFASVPAGQHRLLVELANNDHSSLSPPVAREVRFSIAPAAPRTGLGGAPPPGAGRALPAAGLLAALAALALLARPCLSRRRGHGR